MNVDGAIGRVGRIFVVAYVLLFARQLYVQTIEGPGLANDPHNPRLTLLEPLRGAIVARDGTVLATSTTHGRVYPFGAALAHAVGYDSARYGTTGLEAAYDRDLAARPVTSNPFLQFARIASGRKEPIGERGATVVTTIDPAVERTLYSALSEYPRAAGVAIDPRTGDVLALASVPSFDPGTIDANFSALAKSSQSPLLDRALDGLYPPGSTFKIFTAAAALRAGAVTMNDTFVDPGSLRVDDFTIHDDEGEVPGTQSLSGAFALSSNVDFARIALALGSAGWYAAADAWKLGARIPFALPVERDRLPPHDEMSPGILAQLGFGQADLLVTPLRMAMIGATIAAGGTTPQPFLVRALRRGRHDRRVGGPATYADPIDADIADDVRAMMVRTVQRGTGTPAALPGVQVAGKTGTATNSGGRSHAWFVAFAPAAAPRVAVAIVVENVGYGTTYAAPIARRVIAAALARER